MDLEDLRIDSPDDYIAPLAQFFGISGGVVALVLAALALQSWFGFGKSALNHGRTVARAAGSVYRNPPRNLLFALLVTVLVPVAQAGALILCFLGGNYISMIWDSPRWQRAVNLFAGGLDKLPPLDSFASVLKWDTISTAYVVLGAFLILQSYIKSSRGQFESLSTIGSVLAFPAVILLGLAAISGVFTGLILLFTIAVAILGSLAGAGSVQDTITESLPIALPLIVGSAVCFAYWSACQAAVRSSRIVVGSWKP